MIKVQSADKNWLVKSVTQQKATTDTGTIDWDLQSLGNNRYSLIYQHKHYNLEVVNPDFEEKRVTIKVNGNEYDYTWKDEDDLLLEKMGLADLANKKVSDVKAPMPGLVLEVAVEAGQSVVKGDKIAVLEAMKMENILKSPTDGKVKSTHVTAGDAIDKNQLIVTFE